MNMTDSVPAVVLVIIVIEDHGNDNTHAFCWDNIGIKIDKSIAFS